MKRKWRTKGIRWDRAWAWQIISNNNIFGVKHLALAASDIKTSWHKMGSQKIRRIIYSLMNDSKEKGRNS